MRKLGWWFCSLSYNPIDLLLDSGERYIRFKWMTNTFSLGISLSFDQPECQIPSTLAPPSNRTCQPSAADDLWSVIWFWFLILPLAVAQKAPNRTIFSWLYYVLPLFSMDCNQGEIDLCPEGVDSFCSLSFGPYLIIAMKPKNILFSPRLIIM